MASEANKHDGEHHLQPASRAEQQIHSGQRVVQERQQPCDAQQRGDEGIPRPLVDVWSGGKYTKIAMLAMVCSRMIAAAPTPVHQVNRLVYGVEFQNREDHHHDRDHGGLHVAGGHRRPADRVRMSQSRPQHPLAAQ